MRVDVVMPQMEEANGKGALTRRIEARGETVPRDKPLSGISAGEVDAEILETEEATGAARPPRGSA